MQLNRIQSAIHGFLDVPHPKLREFTNVACWHSIVKNAHVLLDVVGRCGALIQVSAL